MADGIVDIHAHCVPQALVERVEADPGLFGISTVRGEDGIRWEFDDGHRGAPIEPLLVDLPARLARMDERAVAVQVLSGFIDTGAHHVSGRRAAEYARTFNDELAAVVAAHPSRLRGLANLPVQDPEAAAGELEYAIDSLGFVGAQVPAGLAGGPDLEPLWAAAAARRAVILVHPEASTTARLPYFLGNLVGNPAETTAAAAGLIMSGTLERHPDLVVVLVHGGVSCPTRRVASTGGSPSTAPGSAPA